MSDSLTPEGTKSEAGTDGVAAAVRHFLSELCDVSKLQDEDSIFADGFVNSLYLVQLLTFVQSEFSIEIGEDDYDMTNFASIKAVCAFVERKRRS